jgi:hypothetical protein
MLLFSRTTGIFNACELDDVAVTQKIVKSSGNEILESVVDLGVVFQNDCRPSIRAYDALQGCDVGKHSTALSRAQLSSLRSGIVRPGNARADIEQVQSEKKTFTLR